MLISFYIKIKGLNSKLNKMKLLTRISVDTIDPFPLKTPQKALFLLHRQSGFVSFLAIKNMKVENFEWMMTELYVH